MSRTKEASRLADTLYARLWSQRHEAVYDAEDSTVAGQKLKLSTISLPDGLKIGYYEGFWNEERTSHTNAGVLMLMPDRIVSLEFVTMYEMSRCRTSMIASCVLHASGHPDVRNGRPVSLIFRSDQNDILPRIHSRRPTQPYLLKHVDEIAAAHISAISQNYAHATRITTDDGLVITYEPRAGNRSETVWVSHVAQSHKVTAGKRSLAAFAAWRMNEAALALAGHVHIPLAPPPATTGSAKLTRALALCHQALQIDPDLTDHAGTPLRPLLEVHVPELLARHRQASITADARDMETIDAELDEGIAGICDAIDQGLSRIADDRRHALREQLAFLEMRHPPADGLLEIAKAG